MSGRPNQLIEAGLWLKMSGDLEGARRLFEQALKLEPNNGRARELLGQAPSETADVPEELRDVPMARTDLFAVPLPRLFPEEAPSDPSAMPEDWWSASDSAALSSGFSLSAPSEAPLQPSSRTEGTGRNPTQPGWPSPLRDRTPGPRGPAPRPRDGTPPPGTGAAAVPPPPRDRTPGPRGPPARPREGTPPPGTGAPAVPLPAMQSTPTPAPISARTPAAPTPAPVRLREVTPPPGIGAPAVPLPSATPRSSMELTSPPTPTPQRTKDKPKKKGKRSGTEADESVPLPSTQRPPEGTPAAGTAVSVTGFPVDLTPAHTPPLVGETPRLPLPAASPPTSAHRDAWGVDEGPTLLLAEDGPGALELVAEPRIPSGITPAPAPRDTRSEAQALLRRAAELQGLDDHSGAREVLLRVQALHPELPGLPEALSRSEARLQTSYESKIGKLGAIPRVRLKDDEVIWLNLDHRAGFMLAQIDGTLSFEDLFSVSGMSRLDTARILAQLLEQRVIIS